MKLLYFSALFCSVSFAFVLAQNDPKCGTNGPAQLKIIGGVEATPYEYDDNQHKKSKTKTKR